MEQSIDIVTRAEQVIKNLKERNLLMTTSQIRKFLTSVNTLNNKIQVFEMREKVKQMPKVSDIMLSDDLAMQIKYLKIIIAYQSGRIRKKIKKMKFISLL